MVDAPDGSLVRPIMYVGRYAIFNAIARGGFASVHLGRSLGAGGFARTVAIKRLHRQYAQDPEVATMFLDEAHLVARIRHPNVIPTLDLIASEDELMIVMEYVEGVTLRYLLRNARERKRTLPLPIVLRTMVGALRGLHAAHEARNEKGEALNIIHRDVTPDNILIGTDGLVRLLDFGVAKALGQYHDTKQGEMRGKLAYMTPEQVKDEELTRRSDVFSAATVLWEAMTNERLFAAKSITATAHNVLTRDIPAPSALAETPKKLDGIVLQGLERDPTKRWPTAERFAAALEAVGSLASEQSVAQYVRKAGAERIRARAEQVRLVEAGEIDPNELHIPARASMTADEIRAALANGSPLNGPRSPASTRPAALPPEAPGTSAAPPRPPERTEGAKPPRPPPPARGGAVPEPTPTVDMPPVAAPRSTPSELNGWSEPPRTSAVGGQRALLPLLAAALAALVLALLLTRDDESTPTQDRANADAPAAPESATRARPPDEAAPPSPSPSAAQRGAEESPSARPTDSDAAAPAPAAPPPTPPLPPRRPPAGPRPAPVPVVRPKPPPLYGRE